MGIVVLTMIGGLVGRSKARIWQGYVFEAKEKPEEEKLVCYGVKTRWEENSHTRGCSASMDPFFDPYSPKTTSAFVSLYISAPQSFQRERIR